MGVKIGRQLECWNVGALEGWRVLGGAECIFVVDDNTNNGNKSKHESGITFFGNNHLHIVQLTKNKI
jgi:hypothetical protein